MEKALLEIEKHIDWLSSFGKDSRGGVTRLLYTDVWLEAQNALKEKLESLGMEAGYDEVGNLFARVEGRENPEETIATGSHIDTVTNGGRLDGQLGIIGGMIAVKNLLEKHGQPKRSLEIISISEEEGSRFPYGFWGSKNIFALAKEKDVRDIVDSQGKNFVDEMRRCGFDFKKDKSVRKDLKAFIELHIEQGNFLDMEDIQVGIITSIVGIKRYEVKLKGESNHAGTTLMGYRKDTVQAFARMVTESIAKAKDIGDPLVLTFGKVDIKPNTVNVVPGELLFTIDCRHTSDETLSSFTEEIEDDMKRIAEEMEIEIEINRWMNEKAVPMDDRIISTIENICKSNGLNYKLMHSGAGHDSQIFAPRVPTGMIFVPSIKGISHSPAEDTRTEDLLQGIIALEASLYELAYK